MTDSFTNQQRRVATKADETKNWGGYKDGSRFRCNLCGHHFKKGDGYRWVYSGGASFETESGKKCGVMNVKVCDACDGPDVIERWVERNKEFFGPKFWAFQ